MKFSTASPQNRQNMRQEYPNAFQECFIYPLGDSYLARIASISTLAPIGNFATS